MIYIAGISIALFISALLLNKQNRSRSDTFLLIWMFLIAAHLYLFYTNFTEQLFGIPHLLGIEIPLPLVHGVFLYYYVSSVTDQLPQKNRAILLHLIPIISGYLYLLPFFMLPAQQKVRLYENGMSGYEMFMAAGLKLIFLSGIVYVVWSSLLLRKHQRNIRNQFSNVEAISLRWLKFLVYGLGGIWCIVIFVNKDDYIFAGVSVFAILIGFFGLQQKDIFGVGKSILYRNEAENFLLKDEKEKYAKSGLNDKAAEDLFKNLMILIDDQDYYKRNDLSLTDLASELRVHPNYLSQIINEKAGKSFYDFINTYRVEEFKRLIKIPANRHFTLLALAYDCGFNSKSSFNRYFKQKTGQTPSQYVKSLVTRENQ